MKTFLVLLITLFAAFKATASLQFEGPNGELSGYSIQHWNPQEEMQLNNYWQRFIEQAKALGFKWIDNLPPFVLVRGKDGHSEVARVIPQDADKSSYIMFIYDGFFQLPTQLSAKSMDSENSWHLLLRGNDFLSNEQLRIFVHEVFHIADSKFGWSESKDFQEAYLSYFSELPRDKIQNYLDDYLALRFFGEYSEAALGNRIWGREFGLPTIYSAMSSQEAFADIASFIFLGTPDSPGQAHGELKFKTREILSR